MPPHQHSRDSDHGFAEAVRALGWAGSVLLYAFSLSAIVLVFWLFVLAG